MRKQQDVSGPGCGLNSRTIRVTSLWGPSTSHTQRRWRLPTSATRPRPTPALGGLTPASRTADPITQLEQLPHDQVHVVTGGGSSQADCTRVWITAPDCAAADPVFWTHHSNIDRLWKRWLDTPVNLNPTDHEWLSRQYRLWDPDRGYVDMAPNDVLDTVAQLGYAL